MHVHIYIYVPIHASIDLEGHHGRIGSSMRITFPVISCNGAGTSKRGGSAVLHEPHRGDGVENFAQLSGRHSGVGSPSCKIDSHFPC